MKKQIAVAVMMAASAMAQTTPSAPSAPSTPKKPRTSATPRPAPAAPHVWVREEGGPQVVIAGGGRSYLGVDVQEVTQERLAALKLKEERGVEVMMVDKDAPAFKAGLKEHDVILEFNGAKVEGQEQLRRMIRETPPGRSVALLISREGQQQTLNATLGDRRPKVTTFNNRPFRVEVPEMEFDIPEVHIPDMSDFNFGQTSSSSAMGVQVEGLTPQLGEFFGVKDGEGVLVRSVEKGSPAEQAGIKAGDVIVKVDSERIADRNDLRHYLRGHSGKVSVGLVRDKREQTVAVTLPERKRGDASTLRFDMPEVDLADIVAQMNEIQPQLMMAQEMMQKNSVEVQKKTEKSVEQLMKKMEKIEREQQLKMKHADENIQKQSKELQKRLERMGNTL